MKKHHNWVTTLFSLTFIALPAVTGYGFFLPDWTSKPLVSYGYLWLIGFGYLFYVLLISQFFIYLKVLNYDSLIFIIPLAVVFFLIFITHPLYWWLRAIIVLSAILLTIPVRLLVEKKP